MTSYDIKAIVLLIMALVANLIITPFKIIIILGVILIPVLALVIYNKISEVLR